jgi:hypothetical protein
MKRIALIYSRLLALDFVKILSAVYLVIPFDNVLFEDDIHSLG